VASFMDETQTVARRRSEGSPCRLPPHDGAADARVRRGTGPAPPIQRRSGRAPTSSLTRSAWLPYAGDHDCVLAGCGTADIRATSPSRRCVRRRARHDGLRADARASR
jgi:hypothetical protein